MNAVVPMITSRYHARICRAWAIHFWIYVLSRCSYYRPCYRWNRMVKMFGVEKDIAHIVVDVEREVIE